METFVFDPGPLTKLAWSLPWLLRYPFWRARQTAQRLTNGSPAHLVFVIANHYEPGYNEFPNESGGLGITLDWQTQIRRVEAWCKEARATGQSIQDHDSAPLRHTNFYPAEQYNRTLIEHLAASQAEGWCEIEIHLHHGVDTPDTEANLRRSLEDFRDLLAHEHKCLSRMDGDPRPMYAFIHGNWALANSAGGRYCGVDSEMKVLAETGCYADLTLPSAPDRSQVPQINSIYHCGLPLDKRSPHRKGSNLKVGLRPNLPVIFTGPLVLDLTRRKSGIPVPRFDNGVLSSKYPLNLKRLENWCKADIGVRGRPNWAFIKLFCHGFLPGDESTVIGEDFRRFFGEVVEFGERSGQFKVHFATAREAFNMIMAAVDGHVGEPGDYRQFLLKPIISGSVAQSATVREDLPEFV